MEAMRLCISPISGSGALDEVAQIVWFGQPSHALALPASAEAVPGQCSGASAGVSDAVLLIERHVTTAQVMFLLGMLCANRSACSAARHPPQRRGSV